MDSPEIVRDNKDRIAETTTSTNEIRGPLGIWPYPILNLIMQNQQESNVQVTRINRDNTGRIESIEEIKL